MTMTRGAAYGPDVARVAEVADAIDADWDELRLRARQSGIYSPRTWAQDYGERAAVQNAESRPGQNEDLDRAGLDLVRALRRGDGAALGLGDDGADGGRTDPGRNWFAVDGTTWACRIGWALVLTGIAKFSWAVTLAVFP